MKRNEARWIFESYEGMIQESMHGIEIYATNELGGHKVRCSCKITDDGSFDIYESSYSILGGHCFKDESAITEEYVREELERYGFRKKEGSVQLNLFDL